MIASITVCVALLAIDSRLSENKGKLEGTTWSSLAHPAGLIRGKSKYAGALLLEFAKDGKLTLYTSDDIHTGTYSLLAGDVVSWTFDRELSTTGKKRHYQKCVVAKTGALAVSDADGPLLTITFERLKELPPSANKGKIEGTRWSSLAGTVKGRDIPAGTLKLEFAKDGKLTYDTPAGVFTGTYELRPGDKVLLKLDRELGGSKTHNQKVVINNQTGKLTMSDSDGTSLDFEKEKD